MSTGIKQKVTQDQWENEREWVVDSLDSTMQVQFKLTQGRPVDIVVQHYKEKRSNKQNAFLWAMFDEVATQMTKAVKGSRKGYPAPLEHLTLHDTNITYTKEDAHDLLLQKRYGVEKRMIGNTEVITQKNTSKMDVLEATDFIEWCLSWCADRGWSVMMPPDYASWARSVR